MTKKFDKIKLKKCSCGNKVYCKGLCRLCYYREIAKRHRHLNLHDECSCGKEKLRSSYRCLECERKRRKELKEENHFKKWGFYEKEIMQKM